MNRAAMAIFTIGYGGRKFLNFISLLKQNDIAFVVDIRRFPKSTVPAYSKESLEAKGLVKEAELVDNVALLFVYETGWDKEGMTSLSQNQAAAEAVGYISQYFDRWELDER